MPFLSDYISINRRYSRSVNIERDLEIVDSVLGYIPTSIAIAVLQRLLKAFGSPYSVRAWTLTGPYGTGKSAFAHFITSLCAPATDENSINALDLLNRNNSLSREVVQTIPKSGLLRAVVTAQREPIAHSIVKALDRGASIFWKNRRGVKPKIIDDIEVLSAAVESGANIENQKIITAIIEVAEASKSGLLLIIDELGKSFEFSAQNQSLDDLYLLQQIAELPSGKNDPKVLLLGLLHQSFADYSHGLSAAQRKEWAKIQGRFEDIPYADSTESMLGLIGNAINQSQAKPIVTKIHKQALKWKGVFNRKDFPSDFSGKNISKLFPLHPVSAVVLPILCAKFSQNGRTLFSFLSSEEPHSLTSFLKKAMGKETLLTTFKLHTVYDYFVEAAGMSFSLRPQFQRWVEIQSRIADAGHMEDKELKVLKTVGILNLVSTAGALKATRKLAIYSMCDAPDDTKKLSFFDKVIDNLISKGFLSYRKQLDELRIWEGSDFDVEKEISEQSKMLNVNLASLLAEFFPQKPLIARRHSYQTGTVRYFERKYIDDPNQISNLSCDKSDSDGLICYWLGTEELSVIPEVTKCEKPLIILCATDIEALKIACYEYAALKTIEKDANHLQTDGVARREVRQRVLLAQKVLADKTFRSFDVRNGNSKTWIQGRLTKIASPAAFQKSLSIVCDEVYNRGLRLWNELVNKRVTTSQGSAARRRLLEVMIDNIGFESLCLEGYGPEVSLFKSLLIETGIYRQVDDTWCFNEPFENSGAYGVWKAIEAFCMSSVESPISISELYMELSTPPYGVKHGAIPVLLLSVLLHHSDSISFYKEETFVPAIGPEHFEILVKRPEKFAVKSFKISGLKAQFFKVIEGLFSTNQPINSKKTRNSTIINIVRPLITFASQLPQYTKSTKEGLSPESRTVLKALLNAREPDELLFSDLPRACGFPKVVGDGDGDSRRVREFCTKLVAAIKEIQSSYDNLLSDCKKVMFDAFDVKCNISKIRENLRNRSVGFVSQVTEGFLKRFIFAAIEDNNDEKAWLESVIMVVSDRPPRSWTDDDRIVFSTNLADISRRFLNLEALQGNLSISKYADGYDVKLVTITKPNGEGAEPQLIYIENDKKDLISQLSEEILEDKLKDNKNLQKAVLADLFERVFLKTENKKSIQNLKFQIKGRGIV